MPETYSGKYTVVNKEKYKGNVHNVVYRSSWERSVMRWLDIVNGNVRWWNSEETIVPYVFNKRIHRYFLDFTICDTSNRIIIVEVKPKKQLDAPVKPTRTTKRYLRESLQYAVNQTKWKAATDYATRKGYSFEIWTEDVMKKMGIRIVT